MISEAEIILWSDAPSYIDIFSDIFPIFIKLNAKIGRYHLIAFRFFQKTHYQSGQSKTCSDLFLFPQKIGYNH